MFTPGLIPFHKSDGIQLPVLSVLIGCASKSGVTGVILKRKLVPGGKARRGAGIFMIEF